MSSKLTPICRKTRKGQKPYTTTFNSLAGPQRWRRLAFVFQIEAVFNLNYAECSDRTIYFSARDLFFSASSFIPFCTHSRLCAA